MEPDEIANHIFHVATSRGINGKEIVIDNGFSVEALPKALRLVQEYVKKKQG